MTESAELTGFQERLQYRFDDPSLLLRALTHKSYSHEVEASGGHNETLEFLGDSVLGFVIGSALFERFGDADEGTLSKMKAYLVSAKSLAVKARALDLSEFFRLGVGEEKSGGRTKTSLLANLYEAIIGAIFLDGGIDAAASFIQRGFESEIAKIDRADLTFRDFKTALQEVAQARGWALPAYEVTEQLGPDHARTFVVSCTIDGESWEGRGSSKKSAQQQAAQKALDSILSEEQ